MVTENIYEKKMEAKEKKLFKCMHVVIKKKKKKREELFLLWCYMDEISDGPLKLVDKFMYPGRSISSTERDFNIHRVKVWTVIAQLSIILKSDLSDKIK